MVWKFRGIQTTVQKIFKIHRQQPVLSGNFCKSLFKELKTLALKSHTFLFTNNNKSYFGTNSQNYSTCTRNSLYAQLTNLAIYQKGIHFSGLKSLIIFHQTLKILLAILERSKRTSKHFFITHTHTHTHTMPALRRNIITDIWGRWLNFDSILYIIF
jgi:hypothetical protein